MDLKSIVLRLQVCRKLKGNAIVVVCCIFMIFLFFYAGMLNWLLFQEVLVVAWKQNHLQIVYHD